MALFWSLFTGGSFLVDFLKNEIVGFDENLTVSLLYMTCNNMWWCHNTRTFSLPTALVNVNMGANGKTNTRLSPQSRATLHCDVTCGIAWWEELNGFVGYNLVASSFRQSFRLRATLNQWFMRALIGGVKLPPVKWPPHVNCGKMAGCI